ncbi:hypothetical protein [Phenylobacterium sp.]|jgi:hypothetical protein|uniref:hypothetical protein n=1 Tax=Phenylobacterium sp. TaxID=1871053 RepID=UPI002F9599A2
MIDRYLVRPDREGFTVSDIWTGEPAVIAMVPQTGLSREDAEHTADLLNRRAHAGDTRLLQ